jgi:parallel beta-helix repeat protein
MLICAAAASSASARTFYVTSHGRTHAPCTHRKPCRTLAQAFSHARAGDSIVVGRGLYRGQIKLTRPITLIGAGNPVIDASGAGNGVLITGSGASGAGVRGFTIRNATFEGILATNTSGITISRNTVVSNDRGVSAPTPVGECAPEGVIPGDCGEGIHLTGVTGSRVVENFVRGNAGGILLTDEKGPTAHNTVQGNRVLRNLLDCGITLAGHNAKAVILSTAPGPPTMNGLAPSVGGVYSNLIAGNAAIENGTKGQGGGILLAAGPPGAGVYNNTVTNNVAEGNGLAGITLHSHAPGQDLSGNAITHNILSNNGVAGNPGGAPGDSDAGVKQTVDILLWSAVTPLSATQVAGNQLSNAFYGIWTKNVPKIARNANTFAKTVTVPLTQG